MRPVFTAVASAVLLLGAVSPAFAGGIATNHAGFAAMHAAASAGHHHHHSHHRHHHRVLVGK